MQTVRKLYIVIFKENMELSNTSLVFLKPWRKALIRELS